MPSGARRRLGESGTSPPRYGQVTVRVRRPPESRHRCPRRGPQRRQRAPPADAVPTGRAGGSAPETASSAPARGRSRCRAPRAAARARSAVCQPPCRPDRTAAGRASSSRLDVIGSRFPRCRPILPDVPGACPDRLAATPAAPTDMFVTVRPLVPAPPGRGPGRMNPGVRHPFNGIVVNKMVDNGFVDVQHPTNQRRRSTS